MSGKTEKTEFDKSNKNHIETLKKHMVDWYEKHPHAKWISPLQFQQAYSQWDKYSTISF